MPLPNGWNALGILAAWFYNRLDPREQKDNLLSLKEQIYAKPWSPAASHRVKWIDDELLRLQRQIEREVSR